MFFEPPCNVCNSYPCRRQRVEKDIDWHEDATMITCDCHVCCSCGQASDVLAFSWQPIVLAPSRWDPDDPNEFCYNDEWQYGPSPYGPYEPNTIINTSTFQSTLNERYCYECYQNYHKDNPIINPQSTTLNCKSCHMSVYSDCDFCRWCLIKESCRRIHCVGCNCTYSKQIPLHKLSQIKEWNQLIVTINQFEIPPCPSCTLRKRRQCIKSKLFEMKLSVSELKGCTAQQLQNVCTQTGIGWSKSPYGGDNQTTLFKRIMKYKFL